MAFKQYVYCGSWQLKTMLTDFYSMHFLDLSLVVMTPVSLVPKMKDVT